MKLSRSNRFKIISRQPAVVHNLKCRKQLHPLVLYVASLSLNMCIAQFQRVARNKQLYV